MSLTFKLAARCEAAGRPNNEDNFLIDENLDDKEWSFTTDKTLSLGAKGALLVVCDGMGGMNAGEVASAIAIDIIKQWFEQERLTDSVMASSVSIQRYMVDAIQAADAAIKKDSTANIEHEGMGSTIVMAWLLGQKVYVAWCGDSRAYRYNPKTGLERLSRDHSYVQELVDAGKLTEELAFDHPNNNIITRSLGDPRGKAKPDTKDFDLHDGDIILLCSDGLCGCLRDNEIEAVIAQNQDSMQECRDTLWKTDEEAGWHDNVTILLAQILSGGAALPDKPAATHSVSNATLRKKNKNLKIILACVVGALVVGIAFVVWMFIGQKQTKETEVIPTCDNSSLLVSEPLTADTAVKQPEILETVVEETPKAVKNKNNATQNIKPAATEEPKQEVLAGAGKEQETKAPKLTPIPIDKPAQDKANVEEKDGEGERDTTTHQPQQLTPVN